MLVKMFLELAGAGVMALGRRGLRKKAFGLLAEKGLLKAGAQYNSKYAGNVIKALEGGKLGHSSLARAAWRRGPNVANTEAIFKQASGMLRKGKYFGAAGNIMMAAPAAVVGFSMLSDVGGLWDKKIPPPVQETLQTQQMFLPRQAYTQRQRAIQAIHQSQMTTRSALGNEAEYMHG